MKKLETLLRPIAIICLFSLIFASCTPTMHLIHQPKAEGYTYDSLGPILVQKFKDERPINEQENKVPKNQFLYQYPQKHTPQFDSFIQTTMEAEISKSGLFSIRDGEYELNGRINSFKCINKANGTYIAGYAMVSAIAFLNIFATTQGGTVGLFPLLLVGIPGAILSMAGQDHVTSVINFDYTLSRNGDAFFSNTVNSIMQDKISKSRKPVERTASLLDQNLTKAIRTMLKEIDEQCNALTK